jgi:hypothetical protein
MVPGSVTGVPVNGPDPPPPPDPPSPSVVNDRVDDVAMSVGSTGVAKVRDTTFQK